MLFLFSMQEPETKRNKQNKHKANWAAFVQGKQDTIKSKANQPKPVHAKTMRYIPMLRDHLLSLLHTLFIFLFAKDVLTYAHTVDLSDQ
jgi:hypothetical protein